MISAPLEQRTKAIPRTPDWSRDLERKLAKPQVSNEYWITTSANTSGAMPLAYSVSDAPGASYFSAANLPKAAE